MTHDPLTPTAAQREQQAATAERLGYGTGPKAVLAMTREHDPLHAIVAGLLGRTSPTLHWVASGYRERAHPTRHDDAIGWEEDLVLGVQKWLNTGEFNGDIRVLWWLGYDPERLRAALESRLNRGPLL